MPPQFLSVAGACYAVDWLIVRSGYVCAWGWCLHCDAPVSSVGLLLDMRGTPVRVEGHYGIPRLDVAETCGNSVQAVYAGFVFFGRVPEHWPRRVFLEITLATGRTCRIELDIATIADTTGYPPDGLRGLCSPGPLTRVRRRYQWSRVLLGYLAQRGWHHVLRTRGRSRPRFGAGAEPACRLSIDTLLGVLGTARSHPLSLMLDHNLGGGTSLYREQWLQQQTRTGGTVIVLSYDFHRLRYRLRYVTRECDKLFSMDVLAGLLMLAAAVKFDDIVLNNVCSFPDPLLVTSLAHQLARLTGARLTVAVHDYFIVCPSWNLLDDQGCFCAVPPIVQCRSCLPNIRGEVRALVGCDDIDRWRVVWGACLEEATTILCFSRASQALVARAYPHLSQDKFLVRPHAVDYLRSRAVQVNLQGPLHIGVVGEITAAKGAAIVVEMARLIRTQRLPARITIIGQLHGARESKVLRVLGSYQREHLPELVAGCGANIFLLPSIWPETFSYVAEELMQLGVPLAVFNMGAPAERVAQYENGMVIDRVDAAHALQQLRAFHAKLRTR